MTLVFYLIVALGLWLGADANCTKRGGCCMACPEGWAESHHHCFKFIYEEKDWDSAENDCIDRGGNLASIHSIDELNALLGLVKDATGRDKPTWVGGYDAVLEGHWKWADGRPFDFKYWGPGQPNNFFKGQHCLELNYRGDKPNDAYCHSKRSYICGQDMEIRDKQ